MFPSSLELKMLSVKEFQGANPRSCKLGREGSTLMRNQKLGVKMGERTFVEVVNGKNNFAPFL